MRRTAARVRGRARWAAAHAVALHWRALDRIARAERRTAVPRVALTFDDGPHPGSTDLLLDVLAALDVRATFFCVGRNAMAHPALLRRTAAEGHAVGSHSLTHPHPREVSLSRLRAEYLDGRDAVQQVLGRPVPLFRPPNGHLGWGSALLVRRIGLRPWLWSVDPQDWRPGAEVDQVTDDVAASRAGDVVLMHDWVERPWAPSALDRSATLAAVDEAVGRIRAAGLDFTTLG